MVPHFPQRKEIDPTPYEEKIRLGTIFINSKKSSSDGFFYRHPELSDYYVCKQKIARGGTNEINAL